MAVFSQKKNPEAAAPAQAPAQAGKQSSLVGKTLLIKGDVYSEDEILIDGKIQGKITVKNRVVIGRDGDVEAEIDAREVVIQGKVTGNVRGSQRVEIVPSGSLHGNIQSPRVVIADSGFFEGSIEMKHRDEKIKPGEEKPADHAAQSPKGTDATAQSHKGAPPQGEGQPPPGLEHANSHKPFRK
jgi:cytoskeletal protein CcmA (bactofilin family)